MNKNSTGKIKNHCRFDGVQVDIDARDRADSNSGKSNNRDLINALKTAVKECKKNYKEGEFLNAFVASSDDGALEGETGGSLNNGLNSGANSYNNEVLNSGADSYNDEVLADGILNDGAGGSVSDRKTLDNILLAGDVVAYRNSHRGSEKNRKLNSETIGSLDNLAKSDEFDRFGVSNTSNKVGRNTENPSFDSVFETDEDFENAKERALSLLDKTVKTSKELFYFLCDKGYSKDTAEKTVDYIVRLGLINDKEICDSLIRNYFFTKHYSKRVIREKLYNKKIPPEIINESLDNIDEKQETEVLGAVIKKKAETIKRLESDNPDSKSKYRKLVNYALQKGFSYSQIKRVMSSQENETLF